MCLEHPEITHIRNTGYPSYYQDEQVYCEYCGRDITDEDRYEDESHDNLCERCLINLHRREW